MKNSNLSLFLCWHFDAQAAFAFPSLFIGRMTCEIQAEFEVQTQMGAKNRYT